MVGDKSRFRMESDGFERERKRKRKMKQDMPL